MEFCNTVLKITFSYFNRKSPRNARQLLKFNSQFNFTEISWELGNEPNSLKHQLDFRLSGSQLGRDFKRLRKLLDKYEKSGSLLVGPDVNQLRAQEGKKVQKALKYLGKVVKASQRYTKDTVFEIVSKKSHLTTLRAKRL